MSNPVNLTIEPKVIEGIVSAQIQAAIVAQFNRTPEMMESLVASVLSRKVDDKGAVSDYSSYNKYSLVDVLCQKAIKAEAEKALQQWIEENRPALMAALRKNMDKQKNDLVKSFVAAADNAMKAQFRISCDIKLEAAR
jgi:predicted transcriptional regulator